MRKIIMITILAFSIFSSIGITNADTVKVVVTEKIPGASCDIKDAEYTDEKTGLTIPATYECEVGKGASQVVSTLGAIIKYFTYIASLTGVLFIVGNGIMYSMGGADQSLKDESKKRIIGTLVGIVILLLSGPILQIIAPWIYK